MLDWALEGHTTGPILSEIGSGGYCAVQNHETPPLAPVAVEAEGFMKGRIRTMKMTIKNMFFVMLLSVFSTPIATASTSSAVSLHMPRMTIQKVKVVVGVMLPSSPNTYQQYTAVMRHTQTYREGMFTFTVGQIGNVVVVLSSPPPIGSFSLTAIDTYLLEKIFRPTLLIDPGTAGSHLPLLSMGDVVIGARVVNFSNYMTKANGKIVPGQFSALVSDNEGYTKGNPNPEYIYASPALVKLAAASARAVASHTPATILSAPEGRKPWIMTYGTQGSGDAWLRNITQIKASTRIFHEADEAGNYPIALVSTLNKIPFVEIHTISDAAINVPTTMNPYFHRCSEYAQRRSNKIVLQMIKTLSSKPTAVPPAFVGGFFDPWPKGTFAKAFLAPPSVTTWTKKYGVSRG